MVENLNDEWWLYPIRDANDRKRISRTANHILRGNNILKEESDLPTNVIAIAHNSQGDQILHNIQKGRVIEDLL